MAIEDRFGELADENPALQRGPKWLQAHKFLETVAHGRRRLIATPPHSKIVARP